MSSLAHSLGGERVSLYLAARRAYTQITASRCSLVPSRGLSGRRNGAQWSLGAFEAAVSIAVERRRIKSTTKRLVKRRADPFERSFCIGAGPKSWRV